MKLEAVVLAARRLPPDRARAVIRAALGKDGREGRTPHAGEEIAGAAFEKDMEPIREAIVGALQDGDVKALKGLRAMLPELLSEVNESPALADALAHSLGKAFLEGIKA